MHVIIENPTPDNLSTLRLNNMKQEIILHMARAFFASAWADMAEETGNSLSGCEIMDVMPKEIDPAAMHAANTLCMDMERANGMGIEAVFRHACDISKGAGDRPHTAEIFGHYCAMQAMGHGVGLADTFGTLAALSVKVPYIEFGSCSLQKDYFQASGEEEAE